MAALVSRIPPVSSQDPYAIANMAVEFDAKGMPFRRLGSSGLRVPLFSLGGCQLPSLMKPDAAGLTQAAGQGLPSVAQFSETLSG